MGKQFISTVSAAQAHQLDILSVVVTDKYTITVSSDGYAAFWDNKKDEIHVPLDHVVKKLINNIGIHHVAAFEDVPTGQSTKICVVAFACFDGSILFYYYETDNLDTFTAIDTKGTFKSDYWCPGFFKDPQSVQHYFLSTKADGTTAVFEMDVSVTAEGTVVNLLQCGIINASTKFTSFPNSMTISPTTEGLCAVGYTAGDIVIYGFKTQKQVFTFHSTDIQAKDGRGSTSIPRALCFSPGGSLLAVARDNQSAGIISLYDVQYGENVGSLTTLSHSAKTSIGGFAHDGWIMGLSFNEDGSMLASCGFDKCVRVWNMVLREREATIQISATDLEDTTQEEADLSICSGISYIRRGVRGGAGGDSNEGLCVVSFDRGVRWYREAGGI